MANLPETIAIIKGVSLDGLALPPGAVLVQGELRPWMKRWGIMKHLFRYQSAYLFMYRLEFLSNPFFHAVLLRMLSRGSCVFQDEDGKQLFISPSILVKLLFRFVSAFVFQGKVVSCVRKDLIELSHQQLRSDLCRSPRLLGTPVYLRTDLHFGLKCGGSVAHTAGVMNQFFHILGSVIFLTPENLPTINKKIEIHEIPPPIRFIDFREIFPLDYNEEYVAQAFRILENRKMAFLYQRYSLNNYSGVLLSKQLGVPLVLEYNGSEIWVNQHWGVPLKYATLSEEIELMNLRSAHLNVVVSETLKMELLNRGIDGESILVNPNGVDPDVFYPQMSGSRIRQRLGLTTETVLGFLGTFGKWHGAEVLAEAFLKLIQETPAMRGHVKLLLIGDGMTIREVKQVLHDAQVNDEAIFTGSVFQAEAPSYLAACDILVSPHVPNPDGSAFFGSPTKLFEYMAMGKGIVASGLDQISDVLSHGATAWLVEPGNVDSLKDGLRMLIEDVSLRNRLGGAARERVVENHTWRQHTERILDALEKRCL